MARPISWLPRLHEIRRAVTGSVRSHYERRELEALFQLQSSAASSLMDLMPTIGVGSSQLVSREDLLRFLDAVHLAEDVPATLRERRRVKPSSTRRKIRILVRRDAESPSLEILPEGLALERGHLAVRFTTLEHLAEQLYWVSQVLMEDADRFADLFEPIVHLPELAGGTHEMRQLLEELRVLEQEKQKEL